MMKFLAIYAYLEVVKEGKEMLYYNKEDVRGRESLKTG